MAPLGLTQSQLLQVMIGEGQGTCSQHDLCHLSPGHILHTLSIAHSTLIRLQYYWLPPCPPLAGARPPPLAPSPLTDMAPLPMRPEGKNRVWRLQSLEALERVAAIEAAVERAA